MPDYDLYDEWLEKQDFKNHKTEYRFYTDYSIGFLTRGCFRKCEFCVNKNYSKVVAHSPLNEFLRHDKKKICLLDDNFLGFSGWKSLLEELQSTEKPFIFRQGLDERLLTEEKCQLLFSSKYDGDYFFAFDNIDEKELIIDKLKIMRRFTETYPVFYVLVGFDRNNLYDSDFWKQDIIDMFERIKILMNYGCKAYIMRYNKYIESPYKGLYITVASWCNQPQFYKRITLREFATKKCSNRIAKYGSDMRYLDEAIKEIPELEQYYNMRFNFG